MADMLRFVQAGSSWLSGSTYETAKLLAVIQLQQSYHGDAGKCADLVGTDAGIGLL